ncbi:MFS general substrate transporter [Irpex rosettiformis]|uniref:MFS general substrate transporter n=1 Tax=Irpex rosettiformis TaxID=378272 RepID=A0ACB8U6D4_9APHY|nr:MFS general substrate transporter [Irpex rosettiformis]
MADQVTTEPKLASRPLPSPTSSTQDDGLPTPPELEYHVRPTGLKGIYTNTHTQVVFLGFVCFMCPGLFNALNGLGGGGQVDPTTSANANSALYATFAVAAFFAGSINNVLGSKITLLLGSIGYAIYIGSYLTVNIHPNASGFVIAAGCILGVCAGLLWTAQGSLMLGYPTESQKGRFIAIFWSIFNLGGVVGASVSLGQNFHSEANSVSNGTYIGFIILTGIGVLIPLLMVDPKHMIRSDGTRVPVPQHPSWKTELHGLWIALKTDPCIVLLFPMFFASNWFYTWQFNDFNGAIFNIRARSLNNLVYWLSQIIGSVSIGFLLDQQGISRRVRAFSGWCVLVFMVFVVHVWAYFYQREYTRASVLSPTFDKIDIFDRPYVGRIFLYVCCGLLDSMWQTTAYWLMGAMSNNPSKLAHFSGFYKSIQSAGAAGIWRADAVGIPYMNMFISTWVLLVAGLVFAFPMIHMRVQDYTDEADDDLYEHEHGESDQELTNYAYTSQGDGHVEKR